MKETTTTRYECSDGASFAKKISAQEHEIALWAKGQLPDDAKLTVPALIGVMITNSSKFLKKLAEVAE